MRETLRQTVELAAGIAIAVLLTRAWLVESFVVPSGSMAPALWGTHRLVKCKDCGYPFACGTEVEPVAPRAVCPNCDFAGNPLDSLPDTPGDRLLVWKSAYDWRPPRRWEMVVFRSPEEPRISYVKRVVGLPGESVEIRGGDVYVNGRIARKSLAQQRAIMVGVYDTRYAPRDLPHRWQGDERASRWYREGELVVCHAMAQADVGRMATSSKAIDWLSYQHQRRIPGTPDRVEPRPVEDLYGYNQSIPRRVEATHTVGDLMLRCRLKARGRGELSFFATDGRERLIVKIDPATGLRRLLHNDREVRRRAGQAVLLKTPALVEFSIFDRQVCLAIDGEPAWAAYPYEPSNLPYQPSSRPLAIGVRDLNVEISRLEVFRDVYYTATPVPVEAGHAPHPVGLGKGAYFVLGDNSPISYDSRAWRRGPAVDQRLLVGRPFLVHFPSRTVQLGRWRLRIPDVSRIRYIR